MAQTQVVITAVDRTKAAAESVVRGMKNIERSAKAVNMAFRFLTGGFIIAGFGKIIEAAQKTEEGAKSVEKLKKTLQDPTLVAAANSISKNLVDGFVAAAGGVTAFANIVRNELLRLGAVQVKTAEDGITILEARIAAIRKKYNYTVKGERISDKISTEDLAKIAEYEAALAAIKENERLSALYVGGPKKRGFSAIPQVDEMTRMENYHKAQMERLQKQTEAQKKAEEEARKLAQELNSLNVSTMTAFEKAAYDFDVFSQAVDRVMAAGMIDGQIASDRMMEYLDKVLPEYIVESKRADPVAELKKPLSQLDEFAKAAAQNMQAAFADFLFDPFQDGLRGMLKGFIDTVRRMVAELMASYLLRQFFQWMSGFGGPLGTLGSALAGQLEKRAMGGPVSSRTPYMVGERGPELFVPGSSGTIVPNHAMGGVTVAPVYNIDARGATADLQKALPGILNENNRRIFDELDRRYGIGR